MSTTDRRVQTPGFFDRFLPGLKTFTHYQSSWLRSDLGAAQTPVEWVVVDASSVNVIDVTALQKLDELRDELAARGIVLATARGKRNLWRFFNPAWGEERRVSHAQYRFETLKSAVNAFNKRDTVKAP